MRNCNQTNQKNLCKRKKYLPTWQFHICWPPGPSWACIRSPSGCPCWCKQTGNGHKELHLSPRSSGCCCPPMEKTCNSLNASACVRQKPRIPSTSEPNLAAQVHDASVLVEKWQKDAAAGVQLLQGQRLCKVLLLTEIQTQSWTTRWDSR